ncbi:MAG: glycosyltransferase family 1 protein [Methylophilaceae bacterium]|nr:glycosyltransferase family 1 protein [Methylophilaceae bacterium]
MKVVLSAICKFHTFDLARELYARGALAAIFTGYPRFKLKNEALPDDLIKTFPWVQATFMGFPWRNSLPHSVVRELENLSGITLGNHVARNLPECDLYVGLSGSALPAGKKAHQRGAKFICDRGSSHIRSQDDLLREEHALWNLPFVGIDPRTIAREELEYQEADCITVPSTFVYRSFVEQGIPANKLRLLPYGVNLSRFQPVDKPTLQRFDMLFVGGMSLRKGVQYLVQAYQKINHPAKSLTFVGAPSASLIEALTARGLWPEDAIVLGHMPQTELKQIMSRSHVLVLPSLEEGLAMVMAQAMACGCPVVASNHTGAEDLMTDGVEGFIVPVRNVSALTEKLQHLADEPTLRDEMGKKALQKVQKIGGWHAYGDKAMDIYKELVG